MPSPQIGLQREWQGGGGGIDAVKKEKRDPMNDWKKPRCALSGQTCWQSHPLSIVHAEEQPSPSLVLKSSHASPSSSVPLPQTKNAMEEEDREEIPTEEAEDDDFSCSSGMQKRKS
jgi:hypothetical protein